MVSENFQGKNTGQVIVGQEPNILDRNSCGSPCPDTPISETKLRADLVYVSHRDIIILVVALNGFFLFDA